jgi:hypothetical protein
MRCLGHNFTGKKPMEVEFDGETSRTEMLLETARLK